MPRLRILLAVTLLTFVMQGAACTQAQVIEGVAKIESEKIADGLLTRSIWYICRGASVGAVSRRFGNNSTTWNEFCKQAVLDFSKMKEK